MEHYRTSDFAPRTSVSNEPGRRAGQLELLYQKRDLAAFPIAAAAFEEPGRTVRSLPSLRGLFVAALTARSGRRVVMLDIEPLGGVGGVFDRLRRLRDSSPETVVIIASRATAADDTGTTRLALCDATARLPLDRERFEELLEAALDNNLRWRMRRLEQEASATVPADLPSRRHRYCA